MTLLIEAFQDGLKELLSQGLSLVSGLVLRLVLATIVLALTRYGSNSVRRLVALAVGRTIASASLRSLMVQTSFVATWVGGILAASVVAFPDLELGDIIGLLGLGSVAIGFAFQDIFKNFLSGILLLLQEPFRIGDEIRVGDFIGIVEAIEIRSTQIRTYQGEHILIPNAIIFTSEIQVMTALPYRRTDLAIGVDYNTPLASAVSILREAVESVPGVLGEPEVEVDIVGFGDSSIDCITRYWTRPSEVEVRRTRTQVIIALKQACDRSNINIPYPIRTVYWFDQEKFQDYLTPDSSLPNAQP